MNKKEQITETLNKILDSTERNMKKAYSFTSEKVHEVYTNQMVQTNIGKARQFFTTHKQICIGVGVALIAVFLIGRNIRNKKRAQKISHSNNQALFTQEKEPTGKQQKKKLFSNVPPTNKIFMDEEGVQFFLDQPSTDIVRKQSSMGRKKSKLRNSSSQEDQRNDRLFFQMMETYRKTQQSD